MSFYSREPVAAGSFYPAHSITLKKLIKTLIPHPYVKRDGFLNGLISPHAGYVYSGRIAAKGYYLLSKFKPRTFVIIGPNHTGLGDDISVLYNANYKTPMGSVRVDRDLGVWLCNKLGVNNDFLAHAREHSIEVQLPFLQYLFNNPVILPIVIGNAGYDELIKIGSLLAERDVTIIASSDFTHYGPVYDYEPFNNPEINIREHDMKAINLIQQLRVKEFYNFASKGTICGYKPITILMQSMSIRKAKPVFLGYSTSGEITGEYDNAVGYASIAFK